MNRSTLACRLATTAVLSLTSPAAAAPAAGSGFTAVAPRRVLDTRDGTGSPVRTGDSVRFSLAGSVPSGTRAVVVTMTATNVTRATYLSVDGGVTSALNVVPGDTSANQAVVALGDDRAVTVYDGGHAADVVIDLAGYFTAEGAGFTGLSPTRVLDTRDGRGPVTGALTLDLSAAVPAGTTAVVLNLTGVDPTARTHVTAYPAGTPRPLASSLSLAAGETRPSLVTVAVGQDRKVVLANHAGSVHLVADLGGYYAPWGDRYHPVPAFRLLDTRTTAPLAARTERGLDLAHVLPAEATALVHNLTATEATTATFVSAYPGYVSRPLASTLNPAAGQTVPNLAITAIQSHVIAVFNLNGSVHLIDDVQGYFAP